ncbi:methyl-accepting chemotaxis protein [Marinomonas posidonica]|uniref:Methyl-accepting chemotaxis sensory transducer with Cache sensor n=1 Tax=Marinomonas posidonica (strain CECT 7376 / NCIMB 14433 / IVIA-Po-181) TaxID=491952 RepID=F6CVU1_MARPP|nr:methyl-accepting chemotaxis protein [Marinomonas posidonica]AEF53149.1 methyl-accepting chemotaxis sensory transducer with Cache sensor [Marinomonas posidonica IVIA-Po-181]
MKLSRQLSIIITCAAIGLIILGAVALQTLRTSLIDSGKHEIQTILTLAKEQVAHYIDLEQAGKLSREEAEEKVVETLSHIRYDASYIWANDNNSLSRVHPKSEKIGTFQESYKSDIAKLQSVDFAIKISENFKPGTTVQVLKINGMTKLPHWNWVIGFGIYMDDVNAVFVNSAISFGLIGLLILAAIIIVAVYIARSILKSIGGEPSYAMSVTSSIADGYLNETIEGKFTENSLLGSIARMQKSLQEMVRNINNGSALLTRSTNSLNEQMQQISSASQKSSDASYSTASAIQELSACIEEIANSARNTESDSEESSKLSLHGEEVVKQSAQSINDISNQITRSTEEIDSLQKRSLQIGNIVDVIRDIAEQTNLLALNAAIEAARAGEQGRGFAVVADEVRTLASRTATATSEITETINIVQTETEGVAKTMQAILPKVEESVNSSDEVSQMLTNIRTGTDKTLNRIREVSHSSDEQNKATESLAQHVEEISNMVNETAKAVESSRNSVADLDTLAAELHQSVSYFKV